MGSAACMDRPGGECFERRRVRPLDMAHLARQTMNDRALEQEVLRLFCEQVSMARATLPGAPLDQRARLAHGIRGAASGIGAFDVARHAASLEADPDSGTALRSLTASIDQMLDFIASIHR